MDPSAAFEVFAGKLYFPSTTASNVNKQYMINAEQPETPLQKLGSHDCNQKCKLWEPNWMLPLPVLLWTKKFSSIPRYFKTAWRLRKPPPQFQPKMNSQKLFKHNWREWNSTTKMTLRTKQMTRTRVTSSMNSVVAVQPANWILRPSITLLWNCCYCIHLYDLRNRL